MRPITLSWAGLATALLLLMACTVLPAQAPPAAIKHPPGEHVVVNGARLWVEGEGQGEALVLVAGGPGDAHYFHPGFSAIADTCRVICFDAFGRGRSDRAKSPAEYTFERDVEDLEGLRQALKLGRINLLGHSYGGMVAQAYALKYPANVKRLILASSFYCGEMWQANNESSNHEIRNQYPELWEQLMALRARGLHSADKAHRELYGQVPAGLLYYFDASRAEGTPGETNPEVYYQMVGDDGDFLIGGDIARLDFRTRLKELHMPVLILAGRFDRVALPRYAVQFKTYAPQASFVMFERSGHNPFHEEPDKAMGVLRAFLANQAP